MLLIFLSVIPEGALNVSLSDPRRVRVGHGTLIHMSDRLKKEFAEKAICLEACLSANKRIGLPEETQMLHSGDTVFSSDGKIKFKIDREVARYFSDVTLHPIKMFLQDGIPVCLGSDNPLLMNTSIGKEHSMAYLAGVESDKLQLAFTKNAISYANVDFETREKLTKLIAAYEDSIALGQRPQKTVLGYKKPKTSYLTSELN
ncbi:MAG: hypothetical protein KDJ35_01320 [Alphaproteobacteria bacterium]|nr:hypothetical protein [Alphaproteobacteria bacterium]